MSLVIFALKVVSGKRIANAALYDCLKTRATAGKQVPFEQLWKALLLKIETDPEANYHGLTEKTEYKLSLTARGNLDALNVVSERSYRAAKPVTNPVVNDAHYSGSVWVTCRSIF